MESKHENRSIVYVVLELPKAKIIIELPDGKVVVATGFIVVKDKENNSTILIKAGKTPFLLKANSIQ
jgi:hypothetical protein